MFIRTFALKRNLEIISLLFTIIFSCGILTRYLFSSDLQISEKTVALDDIIFPTEPPFKEKLKSILKCRDHQLQMEKLQYGQYWLMKNYIRGRLSKNMECAESITYTTNGDYTFIENLPTVVMRWLAPISLALYAPGYDYNATMDSIQYARHCLPQSQLIRDYVTFHIYFPNNHMPSYIARNEEEALEWQYDCETDEAPYENVKRSEMYKTKANLTYPINVGRNIARKTVNTYFIFACDIELYPSFELSKNFLNMVIKNASYILKGDKPKVFPMPVFEVQENATIPDTKEQLKEMLNNKMAIPFHYYVCSNCHLVPHQREWLKANNTDALEVFTDAQRYGRFASWEPFYISDNKEPLFDERVTWEGQSNKRIQNYAMCLMDYEYHILHPAFLVHAPGIKRFNPESEETKQRLKYAADMNNVIRYKIKPEYLVLYGNDTKCEI